MSIALVCAQTMASIRRARSWFGRDPSALAAEVVTGALEDAARRTDGTTMLTDSLAGELVDGHRTFATRTASELKASSETDIVLRSQLKQAAAVAETAAVQLDFLAAQARITSSAAATAKTLTAQSAILNALRTQVAQTHKIVSSTRQHASRIAGRTLSLDYPIDVSPSDAEGVSFGTGSSGLPTSPILIWCVPVLGGGIGFVCSKHQGREVEIYRAPSDESGVMS